MPGNEAIATEVSHQDGIAVLTVSGEIDLATVPAFEAAIAEALTREPTALIVDLSAVEFLASAGLQALVATQEKVSKAADFAVVADSPVTSRPIELTGLEQILSMHPTMAAAIAAVRAGSPPS